MIAYLYWIGNEKDDLLRKPMNTIMLLLKAKVRILNIIGYLTIETNSKLVIRCYLIIFNYSENLESPPRYRLAQSPSTAHSLDYSLQNDLPMNPHAIAHPLQNYPIAMTTHSPPLS